MHGQFVWYELTTPDADSAQKFYPKFTGWGTQPFDKDYTMFTTGGVPVAGIFRLTDEMRQQGVPPNWMPYVEADNVDDTVAKATSLGGRVVAGPSDIPGTGRFAVLQDPQGAAFGVYKSSRPSGAWDGTAVVGRFSWHELMAADFPKAFEFYRALFGWEKQSEMDMGGGQMYYIYGQNGKMYGGMFTRFGDMATMHPFWLVYICVNDVGKALATATKNGGTVHRPQMDIPGGSIAILGDPQGAGFALHHVSREPAAAKTSAAKTGAAKTGAKKAATKAAKKATKKAAKRTTKAAAKKASSAKAKGPKRKAAAKSKGKSAARTKSKSAARRGAKAKKSGRKAAKKK
jgi:predicted enzyme related to lactoylglutathione lyase